MTEKPTPPEGMRLLEDDEKQPHFKTPIKGMKWWIGHWISNGGPSCGNNPCSHYATKLTPAELRAARGIPEQPEDRHEAISFSPEPPFPEQPVSDTPRSDARAMQYSWAGDDADFARTLERELAAAQRENAELREQLNEATNFAMCAYCQAKIPKDVELVVKHMESCEKHPMARVFRDLESLQTFASGQLGQAIARAEAAEAAVTKLRESLKYARADFDDCIIGVDCEMPVTRESFQKSIQRIDAALSQPEQKPEEGKP